MSKYHDILGIKSDASKDEIKKAYRTLASKHHPDKDGGDEDKFKEIQEAYDRVSHPDKYKEEDTHSGFRNRQQGPRGAFWDNVKVHVHRGGGFEDVGFAEHLRRQQQNIRIQFQLSLESTLEAQTRDIHLPEFGIPPMEITIPAGIMHGDTIQYGNIPQDIDMGRKVLMVQFIVRNPPGYHVNGLDIYVENETDALDAMVGATIKVKTLDGKTLAVKLPAGSENGTKLKIPAKGLKYKDDLSIRGDMYVVVLTTIPKLSDEEKKIITKLRDNRNK